MVTLTVALRGPGVGSVSISPAGITCGNTCSAQFKIGTVVTLSPTPNPSPFSDWSGDPSCSSGTLTLTVDTSCTATFNPGPSIAKVSGTQLLVQKRNLDGTLAAVVPYIMRGVVWSPAGTTTNTSPSDPQNAAVRRPLFAQWAATDIPLIAGMNANTVRLPIDPGTPLDTNAVSDGGWQTLNDLYQNNIMVVMTVDDAIANTGRITAAVNYYKNHPAVLMFSLGSEWNVNLYFGQASSLAVASQLTQSGAQLIKSLDTNHPVATSYGELAINETGGLISDTQSYVNDICTSVDVWSLNIYRGDNFGTLFQQWGSITTKPMFLGEFGVDAFRTTNLSSNPPAGTIDESDQASWDVSLWNDIFRNLSALTPQNAALGGTVFEFQDEWWKCVPNNIQDSCGFASGGFPDGVSNESYFGLADITRHPRQAYSSMQSVFNGEYNPGTQPVTFTAKSAGAQALTPNDLLGFGEFDKGNTQIYHEDSGINAGRGFNVMAVNPSTGDLQSYPSSLVNFDTWLTRDTGEAMDAMVSFIDGLPNGTIILLAVGDEAGLDEFPTLAPNSCTFYATPSNQRGVQALQALGSKKITSYCYQGSWAMIAVKGEGQARSEQLSNNSAVSAQATFAIPYSRIQASGENTLNSRDQVSSLILLNKASAKAPRSLHRQR
jgi:hypothetical protein